MFSKAEYLREGAGILATHFRAGSTAHIGIDLQKAYFDPSLPLCRKSDDRSAYFLRAQTALNNITRIADDFRQSGVSNIWVRHVMDLREKHFEDGAFESGDDLARQIKLAEFLNQAHEMCIPSNAQQDVLVEKPSFSSFYRTNLEKTLREKDIDTVLITGGLKDVCVSATAFDARKAGFRTYIIDDLTLEADASSFMDQEVFCEDRVEEEIYFVTASSVHSLLKPKP